MLFPSDNAFIDQFFGQQTPNTGEEPRRNDYLTFMGNNMAALLSQTGPAILMTHSNSGKYGWFSAMISPDKITAIIAFEPRHIVFPEGEETTKIPAKMRLQIKASSPLLFM